MTKVTALFLSPFYISIDMLNWFNCSYFFFSLRHGVKPKVIDPDLILYLFLIFIISSNSFEELATGFSYIFFIFSFASI